MKLQFLLFSVLCIVKGQNYQNQRSYVPVIKDGVPVDTPEVQAAKAAHFEAYERAKILAARRPSTGQYRQKIQQQKYQPTQYQQELEGRQQYHQQEFYQSHVVYGGPEQALAAYSAEIPLDSAHYRPRRSVYPQETPEVQAARYQHLLAHASVHEEDDDEQYPNYHDSSLYHIPVITKKGVPVDTPEVRAARQQHLLAHQLAKTGVRYAGGYSHYIPVVAPDGVPYDTPEVYIARASHLAAHHEESTKHYFEEGYGSEFGY